MIDIDEACRYGKGKQGLMIKTILMEDPKRPLARQYYLRWEDSAKKNATH